jgi:hypothetical protein
LLSSETVFRVLQQFRLVKNPNIGLKGNQGSAPHTAYVGIPALRTTQDECRLYSFQKHADTIIKPFMGPEPAVLTSFLDGLIEHTFRL